MSRTELFSEEKQIIKMATELTKSNSYKDNPVSDGFTQLLDAYTKIYQRQEKLVKVGDKQLLQMNRLIRQIKIILDNIPVGIVIVDRFGNIQPSYSQYMHSLFDLKIISGMYIEDVLYLDNKLEEERKTFKNWLQLVFTPSHDWGLISEIAPDLIEYQKKDKKLFYKIKYHRITNEENETSLMIYLVDVTARKRQQQLLKKQEAEQNFGLEIFSALLNQDEGYDTGDFIYEIQTMLSDSKKFFETIADRQDKQPVYNNLFRVMHSLKGLSNTYGMNELAGLAHKTEELFGELRAGNIDFETGKFEGLPVTEKFYELLDTMTRLMVNAENIIKKLFKRETGTNTATRAQKRSIRIDSEKLSEILDVCEKISAKASDAPPDLSDNLFVLKEKIKDLIFKPIGIIYDRLHKISDEISQTLGKEVNLIISGDKVLLPDDAHHLVIASLIHLLRNSLDHGIELPHVRESAGKQPHGEIKITIRKSDTRVSVLFEDDGAGIDPESIVTKAVKKQLITSEDSENLTDNEKLSLILLPGFSSKEKATETSGRGVGLDVVNDAMEKLNGTLEIRSEKGRNTHFEMAFPVSD